MTNGTGLKPSGCGLYYTHGVPPGTFPKAAGIDHAVINLGWKDVQPSKGAFNWAPIDGPLRLAGWKYRLRIESGMYAPTWVQQASGGGVTVLGPKSGTVAAVPRWWTPTYLELWDQLMAAVAARYDAHPAILDVTQSAPMTINGEPFIRSGRDTQSNLNLCRAGYTFANDQMAHHTSLASMMGHFKATRVSLALHTIWQVPLSSGSMDDKTWPALRDLVNQFRATYGPRLVTQDNGLAPGAETEVRAGETTATASNLWSWFAHSPQPYGFQTKGDNTLTAMHKTIADAVATAIKLKASFVEHLQFGTDAAAANRWDLALKANAK